MGQVDEERLRSTDRADVWAEEFAKVCPDVPRDLMITWFANCAENAKDLQRRSASLFAAAPAMLEALKGVVRVADRKTDEFDAARSAIAMADTTPPGMG